MNEYTIQSTLLRDVFSTLKTDVLSIQRNNRTHRENMRPAVCFDIDDTLLCFPDENDFQVVEHKKFSHKIYNFVKRKGFLILIVTARPDNIKNRNWTKCQLKELDYRYKYLAMLPENKKRTFMAVSNFKFNARLKFQTDFNAQIVLNVGDQWSDLCTYNKQKFCNLYTNYNKNHYFRFSCIQPNGQLMQCLKVPHSDRDFDLTELCGGNLEYDRHVVALWAHPSLSHNEKFNFFQKAYSTLTNNTRGWSNIRVIILEETIVMRLLQQATNVIVNCMKQKRSKFPDGTIEKTNEVFIPTLARFGNIAPINLLYMNIDSTMGLVPHDWLHARVPFVREKSWSVTLMNEKSALLDSDRFFYETSQLKPLSKNHLSEDEYQTYLINHEMGHILGQVHPPHEVQQQNNVPVMCQHTTNEYTSEQTLEIWPNP
jgi:hypothetical protein